jgi:hypothetical protein
MPWLSQFTIAAISLLLDFSNVSFPSKKILLAHVPALN